MNKWYCNSIATLLFAILLPGIAAADTLTSDGYSLEDYHLKSAHDLADLCTLDKGHPDHAIAIAFCYGFFEGAIHYDDVISSTPAYVDIVCSPEGTSRTEAVNEFTRYMKANPQYGSEMPIDAVFRALSAKWPCTD